MVTQEGVSEHDFPNPAELMRIATAYWESQTLLTANRIGLFQALSQGAMDLDSIATALGTQLRGTRLLLRACVALGLLEESADAFHNSPLSQAFLVSGSPAFLGDAIRYSDDLYPTWGKLEEALGTGVPPKQPGVYTGDDPEQTRNFVYGMHNRALGVGAALAGLVDLSGRSRMLDLGGGPGTYSAMFAKRYPGLRSQVFDLSGVVQIAGEIIESMGVGDMVTTLAGNYLVDPLPGENDVVLISGVFHRETEAACRRLITLARQALEPGGLLVVSDIFTDGSGVAPRFATLFGLNMLLTAPDGGVYADTAVAEWMRDAGFRQVETRNFPPPMPHRVILGRRE